MGEKGDFTAILTENPAMKEAIETAKKVAPSDVNILITGESGTGKNVFSEAIHHASKRQACPFIHVNCLAIPDTLIESELFGHEKGAFTDAHALKKGSFECAKGGTVFLDEIGDMTHLAQGKILQAVEAKQFRRVGGEDILDCDARVISATNRNLTKKIARGQFREDLYYRLKEVFLHLPPLRERKEDIPLLIRYFVQHCGNIHGKPDLDISKTALNYLAQHSWPGNIRELKHAIESAVILCTEKVLWLEHFPFELQLKTDEAKTNSSSDFSIEAVLKKHIWSALQYYKGNKKKTASALRISRPRLDRYIEKFELGPQHKPQFTETHT